MLDAEPRRAQTISLSHEGQIRHFWDTNFFENDVKILSDMKTFFQINL
jgi:hypothetical protein